MLDEVGASTSTESGAEAGAGASTESDEEAVASGKRSEISLSSWEKKGLLRIELSGDTAGRLDALSLN